MELVFETVELVAFTDKPYGAFYSMNDLNWVYESLAKQECQFGGFFLLNLSADVEDAHDMLANTYGCKCSITHLRADVRDDLLVLCGNLKFVVPEEQEEIVALLKSKPWRILLGDETKRFDDNTKKLVDKKWVSAYFVEQIDEEDFSR